MTKLLQIGSIPTLGQKGAVHIALDGSSRESAMQMESAQPHSTVPQQTATFSHPVIELRPAFRAQPWMWLIIFICAVVAAILTPSNPGYTQFLHLGSIAIPLPLPPLFPVLLMAVLIHRARDAKYVLCGDHVTEVNGLLSFRLRSERIFYLHVRGIEVDQSLMGRLLNYGNVQLTSDVTSATQTIVLRGIAKPSAIKDEVQRRVATVLQAYTSSSTAFV